MKKYIVLFLLTHIFLTMNAQNKNDILINKEYTAHIGYQCEETPEPNPCAGLQMYLVVRFTKERMSIIEKDVSSCGTEHINSTLEYKWELTQDNEIKMYSKPEEIEYTFLKNLVLNIDGDKVIGHKKYSNNKIEEFEFKSGLEK